MTQFSSLAMLFKPDHAVSIEVGIAPGALHVLVSFGCVPEPKVIEFMDSFPKYNVGIHAHNSGPGIEAIEVIRAMTGKAPVGLESAPSRQYEYLAYHIYDAKSFAKTLSTYLFDNFGLSSKTMFWGGEDDDQPILVPAPA